MIIALTGLAGSGKSTVADMLGGPQVAFAAPLKKFCAEIFGFTDEELYGPSAARERPSARFTRPNGEPLTARYALQTLGTEWGRNCDPDVWAKAGIAQAQRLMIERNSGWDADEHVVITDLRFVNEARLVREAGGEVWRIARAAPPVHKGAVHASEADVWSSGMTDLVSREIDNTGTLEQLRAAVRL